MLISCIMPTYNRRAWIPAALKCFFAQTWAEKELVVIDDGTDAVYDLFPASVHYIHLHPKRTIGAKRNIAISHAAGDVIAHWDDDDWSAPGRLADQMARILAGASITGYHSMIFEDKVTRERWKYSGASHYALGSSLMYTREFWRRFPFPDRNVGEDNALVYRASREIVSVDAGEMMLASIHPGNTSSRSPAENACWRRL